MFAAIVLLNIAPSVHLEDVSLFKHISKEEVTFQRELILFHKDEYPGRKNRWRDYLKATLTPDDFVAWDRECDWRYMCWDKLDDVINADKHKFGTVKVLDSLARLQKLLGVENYNVGRMPDSLPQYNVEWLHHLWTQDSGFQGRLNNLAGVLPID